MSASIVLRRSLALLAIPLALAICSPAAPAQKIAIGFGKHGHKPSIHVNAGISFGAPRCRPPVQRQPVHCAPRPVWIPGHFENVERRVYVPGCTRQVYVPPVYEDRSWRDYSGCVHVERIQVCAATWRTVQDPGTWKCVTERVWVEGGWRAYAS